MSNQKYKVLQHIYILIQNKVILQNVLIILLQDINIHILIIALDILPHIDIVFIQIVLDLLIVIDMLNKLDILHLLQ